MSGAAENKMDDGPDSANKRSRPSVWPKFHVDASLDPTDLKYYKDLSIVIVNAFAIRTNLMQSLKQCSKNVKNLKEHKDSDTIPTWIKTTHLTIPNYSATKDAVKKEFEDFHKDESQRRLNFMIHVNEAQQSSCLEHLGLLKAHFVSDLQARKQELYPDNNNLHHVLAKLTEDFDNKLAKALADETIYLANQKLELEKKKLQQRLARESAEKLALEEKGETVKVICERVSRHLIAPINTKLDKLEKLLEKLSSQQHQQPKNSTGGSRPPANVQPLVTTQPTGTRGKNRYQNSRGRGGRTQ
jgi:hypothetical protein